MSYTAAYMVHLSNPTIERIFHVLFGWL